MKARVSDFVRDRGLVPPISMLELREYADELVAGTDAEPYRDYVAVLLNNDSWRDTLAAVPYHRRLLLLPVCLRHEEACPAPFDELGLLCKECGQCSIHDFKIEAERLGYAMLIAEGSPIVMQLIETGRIDAIVGVACLNVLERVFPYIEAAAIPSISIPLLQDDCSETTVDIDWLWDVVHLTSDDRTYRMNMNTMRDSVASWFTTDALTEFIPNEDGDTTIEIGRRWIAKSGKRWRPFLTAATWQALQDDPAAAPPPGLRQLAVATECFHKASLIHDDIEDGDALRYGEQTLHIEQGVPVAINAGDYLLGEGYRLIAECGAPPDRVAAMLKVAAEGHRTLSLGQGAELSWSRDPRPLKAREVLDIFSRKTAPAFQVALQLAAIYCGANEETMDVIRRYSESLGIAYQIRDDIEDITGESDSNDARDLRPSLLLAIAYERSSGTDRELMTAFWKRQVDHADIATELGRILGELNVIERANALLAAYREETIRTLCALQNPTLKGLLRRVVGTIFEVGELETLCGEFLSRNAAGGETVATTTG